MAEQGARVAQISDIREGEIFATVIEDTPVALTRVGGDIRAFGDICTHDDGPLAEGHIADGCVVCPRHGACFDLVSGKPTFPAVTAIPIYNVEIQGEDVIVYLN